MPTAHEVFEHYKNQKYAPLLRGVTGTYLFEIEGAGYWFLSVRGSAISIEEARHDADCTISCDESDFIDILEGRRNLITAAMQGRVKVRGDLLLAEMFHGVVGNIVQNRKGQAA